MDDISHTPTTRPNRQQNIGTKIDTNSDSNSENDSITFPQYIIIESTDKQRPLAQLSPIFTYTALSAAVAALTSVKTLRSCLILVYTTTKIYTEKLLNLAELAGVPVKATPYRSLNTLIGVIRCAELKKCSHDELLENLKSQGVTDHYNISV